MESHQGGPVGAFTTPLGPLEPNVLIAGIEAVAAIRFARALISDASFFPDLPYTWQWAFALYAALGVLALFLIGLGVEGLAGIAERLLIARKGKLRPWYKRATDPPDDWGPGQVWMWKSPQASQEFARRRLRILVSRNTWFLLGLTTLLTVLILLLARPRDWGWRIAATLVLGLPTMLLFVWVWVSANEGWNRAVRDASRLKIP